MSLPEVLETDLRNSKHVLALNQVSLPEDLTQSWRDLNHVLALNATDGMVYLLKLQYRTYKSTRPDHFEFTLISILHSGVRSSRATSAQLLKPPMLSAGRDVVLCIVHEETFKEGENLWLDIKSDLDSINSRTIRTTDRANFVPLWDAHEEKHHLVILPTVGKILKALAKICREEEELYCEHPVSFQETHSLESAIFGRMGQAERQAVTNFLYAHYKIDKIDPSHIFTAAWARIAARLSPSPRPWRILELATHLKNTRLTTDENQALSNLRSKATGGAIIGSNMISDTVRECIIKSLELLLDIHQHGENPRRSSDAQRYQPTIAKPKPRAARGGAPTQNKSRREKLEEELRKEGSWEEELEEISREETEEERSREERLNKELRLEALRGGKLNEDSRQAELLKEAREKSRNSELQEEISQEKSRKAKLEEELSQEVLGRKQSSQEKLRGEEPRRAEAKADKENKLTRVSNPNQPTEKQEETELDKPKTSIGRHFKRFIRWKEKSVERK